MIESIGPLLLGIIIGAVAAAGGLIWWDRRKSDEDMARAARVGGNGGPNEPA